MSSEQLIPPSNDVNVPTPTPAVNEDVSRSTLDTDSGDGVGELTDEVRLLDLDSQDHAAVLHDEIVSPLNPDGPISTSIRSEEPVSANTQAGSASIHSPVVDVHVDTRDCVTTGTSDAPDQKNAMVETTDALVQNDRAVCSGPTDSDTIPPQGAITAHQRHTRSLGNGTNDQRRKGHTRSQYLLRPGRHPPD